jgi:hypothetical protein
MKKRIIAIYRMGRPNIVTGEREIIESIIGGREGDAGILPIPTGVIHFAVTDMTPTQIVKMFKEAETRSNQLPVIVFDISSSDNAMHLDSIMPLKRMLAEFKESIGWVEPNVLSKNQKKSLNDLINCTDVSLDFLLDKISQVGMDGLSEEEKKQLEKLSK